MTDEILTGDFVPYTKDGIAGPLPIWQHRTQEHLFSLDGGETFYDLEEELGPDGEAITHLYTHLKNHIKEQ